MNFSITSAKIIKNRTRPNQNGNYLAYNKYNWSWGIQNVVGENNFFALIYDVSLCPEDINGPEPWYEWSGQHWAAVPGAKAECVDWMTEDEIVPESIKMPVNEKLERAEEANGLCPSDEDKFIWEIDNWSQVL